MALLPTNRAGADDAVTKGPYFIDVGESAARVVVETTQPEELTFRLQIRGSAEAVADTPAANVATPESPPEASPEVDAEGSPEEEDAQAGPDTQEPTADGDGGADTASTDDLADAGASAALARTQQTRPWRRDGRAIGSVRFRDLRPDTEYIVTVVAERGEAGGSFRTAPSSEADLSFLVYGDNRTQHDEHRRVVRPMLEERDVRFLLHTGDMVEMGGRPGDWDIYFEIAGSMLQNLPIFPTLGNHEIYGPGGGLNYLRHLAAPGVREAFYERRYGPVRIFSLDSNADWSPDCVQMEWLRDRLAEPTDARFTFALAHHSPVSSGAHGGHAEMQQAGLVELLREAEVDLFFAGHDHMYERGDADGFKYMIAGGGGAPLYPQNRALASQLAFMPTYHFVRVDVVGDEVHITTKDSDGEVLERCSFIHGAAWRCADGSPAGPVWEGESIDPEDPPEWRTWAAVSFAGLCVLLLAALWRSRRRRAA